MRANRARAFWVFIIAAALLEMLLPSAQARGDLLYVCNQGAGTVGAYTTAGVPVAPNLITGLLEPEGIAIDGNDLYVSSFGNPLVGGGKVGKYTMSGQVINANLVTGLTQPSSIAVSGTDLFVGLAGGSAIGKYTTSGATVNPSFILTDDAEGVSAFATTVFAINIFNASYRVSSWNSATGATVNANLITGVGQAYGTTVSGSNLYVVKSGEGEIGKYTTLGAVVQNPLVSGLQYAFGAAVSGSNLFVSSFYPNGIIGEYATSGATVNANLITGLDRPYGIAVAPDSAIPEPATLSVAALAAAALILRGRRG